jgi:hypothetical protein
VAPRERLRMPRVGEATATTSASSGIMRTDVAMQSAWKRDPTIPIFTLDMAILSSGTRSARASTGAECGVPRGWLPEIPRNRPFVQKSSEPAVTKRRSANDFQVATSEKH